MPAHHNLRPSYIIGARAGSLPSPTSPSKCGILSFIGWCVLVAERECARGEGGEIMDGDQMELTLLRAPDDPTQFSDEHQAELYAIQEGLRKRGLQGTGIGAHPAGDT